MHGASRVTRDPQSWALTAIAVGDMATDAAVAETRGRLGLFDVTRRFSSFGSHWPAPAAADSSRSSRERADSMPTSPSAAEESKGRARSHRHSSCPPIYSPLLGVDSRDDDAAGREADADAGAATREAQSECPICMKAFGEADVEQGGGDVPSDEVLTTSCGHKFCAECLRQSARNSLSCPMCRAPIHQCTSHQLQSCRLCMAKVSARARPLVREGSAAPASCGP